MCNDDIILKGRIYKEVYIGFTQAVQKSRFGKRKNKGSFKVCNDDICIDMSYLQKGIYCFTQAVPRSLFGIRNFSGILLIGANTR